MNVLIYWESGKATMDEVLQLFEKQDQAVEQMPGVKVLREDMTDSGWGVTMLEAESDAHVGEILDKWSELGDGLLRFAKVSACESLSEKRQTLH